MGPPNLKTSFEEFNYTLRCVYSYIIVFLHHTPSHQRLKYETLARNLGENYNLFWF